MPPNPISLITDTPNESDPNRTALNSTQIGRFTFELQSVAVPEPSSFVLCALAALGLLGYARRRRNR